MINIHIIWNMIILPPFFYSAVFPIIVKIESIMNHLLALLVIFLEQILSVNVELASNE